MENNQQAKIKKIKSDFKFYKAIEKTRFKKILQNPNTYKFEKVAIKEEFKNLLQQKRREVKDKIINIKDPNFYKKNIAQREAEKQIQDLQTIYYNGLATIEKELWEVKRTNKAKKDLKTERKEKIKLAKQKIAEYKAAQGLVLKQGKEKIELSSTTNKYREFKNTSVIVTKRGYDKAMPKISKFANQKHLTSIRNAFSAMMPLIIVASFITILGSIPVQINNGNSVKSLMDILPTNLKSGLNVTITLTIGMMAIALAFGIGYNLGDQYKESPIQCGIMGFFGFIVWVGVDIGKLTFDGEGESLAIIKYLPSVVLGGQGIFTALITSIIMVETYRIFKKYNLTLKLPKQVPPGVANSFIPLIPAVIYAFIVIVLRYVAGFNLFNAIQEVAGPVTKFTNNSLGYVIFICFLSSTFWWLGIHGGAIIGIITAPMWMVGMQENMEWWQNGHLNQAPNLYLDPFYSSFVWIGGGGSMIGLAICATLFSKSKQNQAVSKTSLIPAFFNISEPMMFGYPVTLNIYFLIPFMLAPIILALTSAALVTTFGVTFIATPPWLPSFLAAFLTSGNDWKALIISFISIGLSTLIYFPFFKIYDNFLLKKERAADNQKAKEKGISLRELLIQREKEKIASQDKRQSFLAKFRKDKN